MRQDYFRKLSEKGRRRGKARQANQLNSRLVHALNHDPIRSVGSYLVFEINTFNPRTGQRHNLQIRHEVDNGNNRYNVYLDGDKWRRQWSRWGFCIWLFDKIESVRSDWS